MTKIIFSLFCVLLFVAVCKSSELDKDEDLGINSVELPQVDGSESEVLLCEQID